MKFKDLKLGKDFIDLEQLDPSEMNKAKIFGVEFDRKGDLYLSEVSWTPEKINEAYDNLKRKLEEVPLASQFRNEYRGASNVIFDGRIKDVKNYTEYVKWRGDKPQYPSSRKGHNLRLILDSLEKGPKSYRELAEETSLSEIQVLGAVSLGENRRVLNKLALFGRGKGGSTPSHKLFGNLAGKRIMYLDGQEKKLGKKIFKSVPENMSKGKKRSLSHRLKGLGVPDETLATVKSLVLK